MRQTKMQLRLVISLHDMQAAVHAAVAGQSVRGRLGQNGSHRLLVSDLSASNIDGNVELFFVEQLPPDEILGFSPDISVRVWITRSGSWQAQYWSALRFLSPAPIAITELQLVGSGMHLLNSEDAVTPAPGSDASQVLRTLLAATDGTRLDRSVGALIGGHATMERLRTLHLGVIGLGRNGSVFTENIARLLPHTLTLVEGDMLEASNLDAMAMAEPADLDANDGAGINKAACIADHVLRLSAATKLNVVAHYATHTKAIEAISGTDMVVCCVDNDAARCAVNALCSLLKIPLLDIASAVEKTDAGRILGADIRLIIPGEKKCLSCLGGFARPADLEHLTRGDGSLPSVEWSTRRAGSLRSHSSMVVGVAMRLLEDFVGEQIKQSTWVRIEQGPKDLIPRIFFATSLSDPHCPVCMVNGEGSAGLRLLPRIVAGVRLQQQRQQ